MIQCFSFYTYGWLAECGPLWLVGKSHGESRIADGSSTSPIKWFYCFFIQFSKHVLVQSSKDHSPWGIIDNLCGPSSTTVYFCEPPSQGYVFEHFKGMSVPTMKEFIALRWLLWTKAFLSELRKTVFGVLYIWSRFVTVHQIDVNSSSASIFKQHDCPPLQCDCDGGGWLKPDLPRRLRGYGIVLLSPRTWVWPEPL